MLLRALGVLALAAAVLLAQHLQEYLAHWERVDARLKAGAHGCSGRVVVTSMIKGQVGNVSALEESVAAAGGRRVYMGKVVSVMYSSEQLPDVAELDLVLASEWDSLDAFDSFQKVVSHHGFDVVSSQAYRPTSEWVIRYVLWLLSSVGKVAPNLFDVATPFVAERQPGKLSSKRDHVLAEMTRSNPKDDDPVLVFNWIRDGDAEQRRNDLVYSAKMMMMLSHHGGGIYYMGKPEQSGLFKGQYDMIAAVHYPDVRFFRTMLNSEWMAQAALGKQPGDTLAVMTVPAGP